MDRLARLRKKIVEVAEWVLAKQGYVCAIDVLLGIGWLPPSSLQRWTSGQLPSLEQGMQVAPARLAEAMDLLRAWAVSRRLHPSETAYVARTPVRQTLRFSAGGDAASEQLYRTHWMSPELPDKKRERIESAASRPPELVVIEPLHESWKCHRCGGSGDFLMMEDPGPACLDCVGLAGLEFLPAGDAALSRRAKAKSEVHAVVVRFSRTRKRYERQGILVQPEALQAAETEIAARSSAAGRAAAPPSGIRGRRAQGTARVGDDDRAEQDGEEEQRQHGRRE